MALALLGDDGATGQESDVAPADALKRQVNQLYRERRYGDAILVAKEELDLREKALGPEHPDVATSLNNLAELYLDHSRYAKAEPLLKRSLAICEKTLGPKHPDVATSL